MPVAYTLVGRDQTVFGLRRDEDDWVEVVLRRDGAAVRSPDGVQEVPLAKGLELAGQLLNAVVGCRLASAAVRRTAEGLMAEGTYVC